MNDTATTYGTGPWGRPRGAPARPADPRAHLYMVPDQATLQPETATAPDAPADHVSAGQIVSDGANPDAGRLQVAGWRALYARTRGYWTPPAILTDPPATLAELADYARTAPWTQQKSGALRRFGIGYHYGLGYPYTVYSRYREWVVQRPLRLAAHLGAIKLLSFTGPGIWVVDHLIYPAARLVGHILL